MNNIYISQPLLESKQGKERDELLRVKEIMEGLPNFPEYLRQDATHVRPPEDEPQRKKAKITRGNADMEYQYSIPQHPYVIKFIYHAMGIIITTVTTKE